VQKKNVMQLNQGEKMASEIIAVKVCFHRRKIKKNPPSPASRSFSDITLFYSRSNDTSYESRLRNSAGLEKSYKSKRDDERKREKKGFRCYCTC